jgi:hypothetical protein
MPNVELAIKVRDQIVDHPETHNQKWWMHRAKKWDDTGSYCETTACAAGWAVLLGDPTAEPVWSSAWDSSSVRFPDGSGRAFSDYAAELLGIDREMRIYLFDENRTVDEVLDVLNMIIDGGTPEIPDVGTFLDDDDDDLDDEDPFPEVDADWGIPEVEHQGAMD